MTPRKRNDQAVPLGYQVDYAKARYDLAVAIFIPLATEMMLSDKPYNSAEVETARIESLAQRCIDSANALLETHA